MSNTAANGKPADAESDPSVTPSAEADQSKQDMAAAVKALTEERNKLQEDIKELKVTYYNFKIRVFSVPPSPHFAQLFFYHGNTLWKQGRLAEQFSKLDDNFYFFILQLYPDSNVNNTGS